MSTLLSDPTYLEDFLRDIDDWSDKAANKFPKLKARIERLEDIVTKLCPHTECTIPFVCSTCDWFDEEAAKTLANMEPNESIRPSKKGT
jgi:hypothetical protein